MNYLSAAALDITDGERNALIEIRELFAANMFHHDVELEADKPDGFNMQVPLAESKCGTTGCIGGWMWLSMNRDRTTSAISPARYVNDEHSGPLTALFYPFTREEEPEGLDYPSYDAITPGAALVAIDAFLTTGRPNWAAACGVSESPYGA